MPEEYPTPLTDTAPREAKPLDKPQKLFDGNGLFLFISPHGIKSWRVKYHFQGREKPLTLGTYPQLSLKEAREACAAAGNHDPPQIVKLSQRRHNRCVAQCVKLAVDDILRQLTRKDLQTDTDKVVRKIFHARREFYKNIVVGGPDQGVFLKGWLSGTGKTECLSGQP